MKNKRICYSLNQGGTLPLILPGGCIPGCALCFFVLTLWEKMQGNNWKLMSKSISYRKHLSVFLAILFILPLLIKWTHIFYVHHEHHHIITSNNSVFHKYCKKCPICAFEFLEFFDKGKPKLSGKPESVSVFYIAYLQRPCISKPLHSIYLRAPPVS